MSQRGRALALFNPRDRPLFSWLAVVLVLALVGGICLWWAASTRLVPPRVPATSAALNVPAGPDLSSILEFDEPANCVPSHSLYEIWQWQRKGGRPKPALIAALDNTIEPSVTIQERPNGSEYYVSFLPLTGVWHGLKVVGLRSEGVVDSDYIADQILFQETPEHVRSLLNRHGFALPPLGQWRDTIDNSTIDIVTIGKLAGLNCA